MKALKTSEYYKADGQLRTLPINTLFARSIVNHYVSGSVYVNDSVSPSTFYISHPYGMSLLFGETNNIQFNNALFSYLVNRDKKRAKGEWLQVFPAEWNQRIEEILGPYLIKNKPHIINDESKVIEYTRVNFTFNVSKYNEFRRNLILPPNYTVNTVKDYIYENMQGSVIPRCFWDNAEDFNNRGIAYCLIHQGEMASTSFSSFLVDRYLEIGIETLEKHRGKGLALYVCSLLIDYCIKHGFEPVWACRSDNAGSFRLAQSLGFEPSLSVPYYKLVDS